VTGAPVASTVDTLYDLAAELLGFCAAALDTLPAGAPARQYVSMGAPVLDCEQLTVHVYQVGEGATSPGNTPLDRGRRAVTVPRVDLSFMVVTIVRDCYPGPTGANANRPPEVADLDAAARLISADGWLLWNIVPAALRSGELWGSCNLTLWEPMQPIPPSGKIAGWTFPLQAKIDGFSPVLPV
jgi:hypothetical protein